MYLLAFRSATTESLNAARALNKPLKDTDPELYNIIEGEKIRLRDCLNLIASENMTSRSVYDALGSVMNNKYSEGMCITHTHPIQCTQYTFNVLHRLSRSKILWRHRKHRQG